MILCAGDQGQCQSAVRGPEQRAGHHCVHASGGEGGGEAGHAFTESAGCPHAAVNATGPFMGLSSYSQSPAET